MKRGLRAGALFLLMGAVPVIAIVAAAPGCKDCAVIPCPAPGFDTETCRCRPPIDASVGDASDDGGGP